MEFFHGHRKKEGKNELTKMIVNLLYIRSATDLPLILR